MRKWDKVSYLDVFPRLWALQALYPDGRGDGALEGRWYNGVSPLCVL